MRILTLTDNSGRIINTREEDLTLDEAISYGEYAMVILTDLYGNVQFTVHKGDTLEYSSLNKQDTTIPVWTPTYDDRFGMVSDLA